MSLPSAVRVLGLCGLVASACSTAAGFLDMPALLGIGGVVMVVANVYALLVPQSPRQRRQP